MNNKNTYFDVNQNHNIFPPSRSYIPQTQIRNDRALDRMNSDFARFVQQQRQTEDNYIIQNAHQNQNAVGFDELSYASQPNEMHQQNSNSGPPPPQATRPTSNLQQPMAQNQDEDTVLQINHLNDTNYADYSYPHVYMQQPFLQLPQKNLVLEPDAKYLSIDSHERDRTKYPNPNRYSIPLVTSNTNNAINVPGKRYKNIYSIELISARIPNRNNVLDEIYLILRVKEFDDPSYQANNPNLANGFAKIMFTPCDGTDKWLLLDVDNSDPLLKVFWPSPKSSLDKISIEILKRDGTPFDFGTDTPVNQPVNQDLQNTFSFRIVEKVVDATAVGHRNI